MIENGTEEWLAAARTGSCEMESQKVERTAVQRCIAE